MAAASPEHQSCPPRAPRSWWMIEDEGGGRYRLSDLRQGRDKAEVLGVAATYRHQTQEVARLSGLTLRATLWCCPVCSPPRNSLPAR